MKRYLINEIFASPQGEGNHVGRLYGFVRFSGCNLRCSRDRDGFDCDTEFDSGQPMTAKEIALAIRAAIGKGRWVCFTGGEPSLQLDCELVSAMKLEGWMTAIESNGTKDISTLGIDYIAISPKTAEHTLRQMVAAELRYVRAAGQGIPQPRITATHHFLSPAFMADGSIDLAALGHCIELIKENPQWRLSVQTHKLLLIR